MPTKTLALLLAVPFLNIALNTLAQLAASRPKPFDLANIHLLAAFAVGTGSLFVMVSLYRTGISLPRGILFMGATSILVGSIWGVAKTGQSLHPVEWGMLAIIALLYLWRFMRASAL